MQIRHAISNAARIERRDWNALVLDETRRNGIVETLTGEGKIVLFFRPTRYDSFYFDEEFA